MALAGASILVVKVVKRDVELSIESDNRVVLDELRKAVEAGKALHNLVLPLSADGTQFRVEDGKGKIIASSPGVTDADTVVLIGSTAEGENAAIAVPKEADEPGPDERHPESFPLDEPQVPAAMRVQLDQLDERLEALTDPDNWSRTEVRVTTPGGGYKLVALTPFDIVNRRLVVLTSVLWLALPVVVVGIAAVAWVVMGRALRPVAEIIECVKRITDRTLDERVPERHSGDEIDELARTMNGMLDRIDTSVTRQRQFVSNASHELRSPITAITVEAEIALKHPASAHWKTVAEVALCEGKRLERLVGDLLALAHTDESAPTTYELVNLDDLVLEEVRRVNRTSVCTAGISAAQVRGNRSHLTRLVVNLLSNAARHATSTVAVGLFAQGSHAQLTVDDDGSGVAPEDRERIFQRFGRLEEGRSRDAGGAGIGLALVKAVVDAHGGTISVSNSSLGGARFAVMLPLADCVAARDSAEEKDERVSNFSSHAHRRRQALSVYAHTDC